ncbi:MAG TPA: ABC transporter substrate-binding protein, partial [Candidatus Atribacteria bacterium]|nr:ABC transporter substrate-binding protein [Candidatus Atribacteria bacterium]
PVEERLPDEPAIVEPIEEIGEYGGTWRHATQSQTSSWVNVRTGYEPLVRYARDGKTIIPNIVKSWEIRDDGKTYIFYLRKGLKWSDGEPFTADDIMFWYEDILLNEDLTPAFPTWLTVDEQPAKIIKVDEYTVRLEFSKPYGILLDWLAQYDTLIPPKHYLKQFHPRYVPKEELERLAKDSGFDFWYQLFSNKNDVALNSELPVLKPWKLVSTSQTVAVLERNPHYWKIDPAGNQLPYIDKRVVDILPDADVLNMQTLAGNFDAQLEFLDPGNFTVFKEGEETGNYRLLRWKRGESGFALFPYQIIENDPYLTSLLHNREFRLALSLAINREEINEIVYLGLADPLETVIFPESMWGSEEAKEIIDDLYSYDPQKANVLLDNLGFREKDKDGFRLRPDGKPLALTIEVPTQWPELIDAADLVRIYWEKVGVKTAVQPRLQGVLEQRMRGNMIEVAGYLLTVVGWISDPRDFVPITTWGFWGYPYALWYQSKGEQGITPPEEIKKLIDFYEEIKGTISIERRELLEKQLFTHFAQQIIAIPTVGFNANLAVVKNYFRNVPEVAINSWPLRFPGYLNPEQFFIKK